MELCYQLSENRSMSKHSVEIEEESNKQNIYGYDNEDDYFKCSDMSATSENALDELLSKMSLNKTKNDEKTKFIIKNEFSKSDFEIIGFLGKGNFANVLKARLINKNKIYALKVVEKSHLEKEDKLYQVFVENEVLRIFDHPNIIKIHGIFEENDKIYTALEYCSAGDFYEFIVNNSKFFILKKLLYNLKQLNSSPRK